MSEPEQYERVSVSSDGVTVQKRFEEDEFPVPAIAFEIESSRSETVTIVLSDEVPESVAVEDLGFHPEYGSEYWQITEDRITFEREIEANSEYTTVYGIRATGTDDVDQFLSEPTIRSVDPPLLGSDDGVVDETGTDVVRDVLAGNSDTVPGLEDESDAETEDGDEDADADEGDVGTLDLPDPNSTAAERSRAGSEATAGETASEATTSLVGALAAELRSGDVEKEDVELLRKAFDLVDDQSGSVDARIKRLQTDVSDLLAYTDALEEFLDENGTAQQTVEEFRSELEQVTSDLEEVRELAQSHESALSEVRSTVDGVESSVAELESEMDAVLDDVDDVQGDVDAVREDVAEVEGTVGQVEETVEDVETSVAAVEDDVDDLASQVGDIDLEGVEGDIDRIEQDVSDLKEWRDQLSSVIGGGN
jgi:archaellum component FlaC